MVKYVQREGNDKAEGKTGFRPFKIGLFKWGNDGEVNYFKRIIRPRLDERQQCLNKYTSGFIKNSVNQNSSNVGQQHVHLRNRNDKKALNAHM